MKKKKRKQHTHAVSPTKKKAGKKIRVGYLSADFAEGRWRDFLPAFFVGHDDLRFEVCAYHMGMHGDTELFAKEVKVFRELGGMAPAAAAEIIRADQLDLLVDLSPAHPSAWRMELLAAHPAQHVVSLMGEGGDVCEKLPPAPETEVFFPFCYTPIQAPSKCSHRMPLLDRGAPTIGLVGRVPEELRGSVSPLIRDLVLQIPALHLVLPAAIAASLSEEDMAALGELPAETAELHLVDEIDYEELDIAVGIGIDLRDVCQAASHGIPLLTSAELMPSRYAAEALSVLGLADGVVERTAALAGRVASFLRAQERLEECHQLLLWRLRDSVLYQMGPYMFVLERIYTRLLFGETAAREAELWARELVRAEGGRDWDSALYAAHMLDAADVLSPEQRMTLAWAYYFLDRPTMAGQWALLAEGLPQEREGARLYLSVTGVNPPGTPKEIFLRARDGLARIETGLSVTPEVHAALLKACADHGAWIVGSAESYQYVLAYEQATPNVDMKRLYCSNGLFTLNAVDLPAEEVYRRSLRFQDYFADVSSYRHGHRRRKNKLRIGYISGDFRQHVMQYFVWPFLAGFNRDEFEVYAYSLGKRDPFTEMFQTLVTQWRDFSDFASDYARIAKEIHADEVDILFDLAGHTARTGLPALAWKPAPIQISGLGYMATTGLREVDYFVTDRHCDPSGSKSEKNYTEKLLRLTSQFCYNGYTYLPASEGTPAKVRGYIQFASFNQYTKLQDDMLLAWRTILERVPQSLLLLKTGAYGSAGIVHIAHERLKKLGFDMNRVQFELPSKDYMLRYLDVDIALDTFPWPGGGTTCDALYMGVPVVSYYTERHSTRFTYSLLQNIGLGDLASDHIEDYIETAVALAGNLDLLDALHRELRGRMKVSPVMDQERYIREMEDCYREIWAAYEDGL